MHIQHGLSVIIWIYRVVWNLTCDFSVAHWPLTIFLRRGAPRSSEYPSRLNVATEHRHIPIHIVLLPFTLLSEGIGFYLEFQVFIKALQLQLKKHSEVDQLYENDCFKSNCVIEPSSFNTLLSKYLQKRRDQNRFCYFYAS